jgi:diguanylate cyclase (GGDEF)-like protein/PAS domain S-box-containing protein
MIEAVVSVTEDASMAKVAPLPHAGDGSRFKVPASQTPAVPETLVRLLLLEVVESDAELKIREVRKAGINVIATRVATRQEFIKALDGFAPDVIVSDYHLPDFDGLAAVKIVRERDADLPFIVVTGALGDEAAVAFIKAGGTDYFLKERLAGLGPAVQHALVQMQGVRRRRLADAARDSLAQIVDNAGYAIIGSDLQGIVTSWNAGAERMLGYAASEIVGTPIKALYPPDRRQEALDLATKVARGAGATSFHSEHLARDGTVTKVALTMSPIRTLTGNIIGVSTIAFALSTHFVAEQSLKEEKAFTDTIIRGLPGTFYVLDEQGGHIRWNEAERLLAGLPNDRMLYSPALDLVHPDDRTEAAARIKEVFDTGQAAMEARIVDAAGTVSTFFLTGRRLEIGGERYLVGHGLDITERKHAENQLRAASLYTRNLIEAGVDPLVVIGIEGRISDVNEATVGVTGMPRELLIGSDFSNYFTEPEKARAVHRDAFSRGSIAELPLTFRHASGSVTDVLCNANIYRNEKGEVAGIVAAARDITERKHREEDFARLHEQVVATVADLRMNERNIALIDGLNETLQTCNSCDEAYPLIAMTGRQLFEQASGALAIFVDKSDNLETVARWGGGPLMMADFSLDDCWALRRGQTHELEAIGKGPLCKHFEQPPPGPYLCLPLSVHGEALGLLHFGVPAGVGIDDNSRRLAGTFGEIIKLALSNLKLREALRSQAIHDPLTGLYNRHHLNEIFSREIHRAKRHKSHLSVVMLDIDHFKKFNDTYGHGAGDSVLRELGKLLPNAVRGSDVVFRYGGEEFVLLLTEADLQVTTKRMDQIRQQIKRLQITFGGQLLPALSVSIGIAQFPEHGISTAELIAAADHAMYTAKQAGRDCIRTFGGDPSTKPILSTTAGSL